MDKIISTINRYPDNGKHLECDICFDFFCDIDCFEIRKGEDYFCYTDEKGKQKEYGRNKIDDRWIVILKNTANKSLRKIFNVKVSKDLDVIINYCIEIYKKSLVMEVKRISEELRNIEKDFK